MGCWRNGWKKCADKLKQLVNEICIGVTSRADSGSLLLWLMWNQTIWAFGLREEGQPLKRSAVASATATNFNITLSTLIDFFSFSQKKRLLTKTVNFVGCEVVRRRHEWLFAGPPSRYFWLLFVRKGQVKIIRLSWVRLSSFLATSICEWGILQWRAFTHKFVCKAVARCRGIF